MIEKLLGANWRTSLSGLSETFLMIVTGITIIPEETWQDRRKLSLAIAFVVAKSIKDFATKDARVAGIGTIQHPTVKPSPDGIVSEHL